MIRSRLRRPFASRSTRALSSWARKAGCMARRLPRSECAQTTILVVQADAVHAVASARIAGWGGGRGGGGGGPPPPPPPPHPRTPPPPSPPPPPLPIHDLLRRRW